MASASLRDPQAFTSPHRAARTASFFNGVAKKTKQKQNFQRSEKVQATICNKHTLRLRWPDAFMLNRHSAVTLPELKSESQTPNTPTLNFHEQMHHSSLFYEPCVTYNTGAATDMYHKARLERPAEGKTHPRERTMIPLFESHVRAAATR